jgi:mono/diheme cytochrome c family protein
MNNKLAALLVLGALVLSACGGGDGGSAPQAAGTLEPVPAEYAGMTNPLGADASAEGAKIFKTNCETCHGPQGYGDGPIGESLDPKPMNLAELQTVVADDFLYWRIAEGSPGTSMPPWKNILSEEQIWQIAAFIRTLK